MPSAAAPSRATNCRSVAWRAASGMLLMRPIVMQFASDSWNSTGAFPPGLSAPANRLSLDGSRSKHIGIRGPPWKTGGLLGSVLVAVIGSRGRERLFEVSDNVVYVLDPDAEPNRLWRYSGAPKTSNQFFLWKPGQAGRRRSLRCRVS